MPIAYLLVAQPGPAQALKQLLFVLLLASMGRATTVLAAEHHNEQSIDNAQARDLVRQFSVPSPYRISARAREAEIDHRVSIASGIAWH